MTKRNKYILGIETSCDETAAAVVVNGRDERSNVIYSSAEFHRIYGGVVPEIASRQHVSAVTRVVAQALEQSGVKAEQIDALAVTHGPGLVGSLLVGVAAAKALGYVWQKPVYAVHHLAGHIAANYLTHPDLEPPFLALVVSGAHSHLVAVNDYTSYRIIARTRDDAPGEAFDKISRELGLGYPGGPLIDRSAKGGNKHAFPLPQAHFENSLDFSFSGLKTAALNQLNQLRQKGYLLSLKQADRKTGLDQEKMLQTSSGSEARGSNQADACTLADFCATFQSALAETLVDHTREALSQTDLGKLVLAGGVSANSELRNLMQALATEYQIPLYLPELRYCTDNAAMIAAQGYYESLVEKPADLTLNATAMIEL